MGHELREMSVIYAVQSFFTIDLLYVPLMRSVVGINMLSINTDTIFATVHLYI